MNEIQKPITSTVTDTPAIQPAAVAPATPFIPVASTVPIAPQISHISFDDFLKVQIRAGKILSAEKIPDTDKLLKLSVDFAEAAPRQIVSGIALAFPDPSVIVGKTCMFVTNLAPRTIRGHESNGMILTVTNDAGVLTLIEVGASGTTGAAIPPGTIAK